MAQTAVEWFEDALAENLKEIVTKCNNELMESLFEQAKEIEKNRIIESWNDGNLLGRNGHVLEEYSNGEQYYNKTYNK